MMNRASQILLAALALWAFGGSRAHAAEPPEPAALASRPSLAVFALEETGDPGTGSAWGAGIAEVVRDALAHVDRFRLYSTVATRMGMHPPGAPSQGVEQAARGLRADRWLFGTVETLSGVTRVNLRVSHLKDGMHVLTGEPATVRVGLGNNSSVATSVGEVVRAAFSLLEIKWTGELEKQLGDYLAPTRSAAAWKLWCEAAELAQSGRASDLHQAAGKLDESLKEDPFFVLAYLKLSEYWAEIAWLRMQSGGAVDAAWESTYTNARKATNLRTEAGAPLWRLALGYSNGPRADEAKMKEAIADAIARLPGEADAWHAKWVAEGRDPQSKAIARAIALDPWPARYTTELAAELSRRGKLSDAEAQIDAALRLAPRSPRLAMVRGDTAMRRNRPRKAREFYEQAVANDPTFVPALVRIAELDAKEGREGESFTGYERVVEADPSHPGAHYRLAYEYHRTGRMSEAIHHYQLALQGMPRNAGLHVNLAQAYQAAGFVDQTLRYYQMALQIDPSYLQARVELAAILYQAGDLKAAAEVLEQAVKLNPDSPQAHFQLALTLSTQQDYDAAAPHYLEAIRLDPGNAAAHHNLALILMQQGDMSGASAHLKKACRLGQREACQANEAYEQYSNPPEPLQVPPRAGTPGTGAQ